MTEETFMRLAIDKAKEGVKKGQTPFGACVVRDGKVLSCVQNLVWESQDITAHAEINAIRDACNKLHTVDLSGCTIYSTCEPCPMCFSACHWANINRIVFGAKLEDAKRIGFNELVISNKKMKQVGNSHVEIIGGFLREENLKLFEIWSRQKDKQAH